MEKRILGPDGKPIGESSSEMQDTNIRAAKVAGRPLTSEMQDANIRAAKVVGRPLTSEIIEEGKKAEDLRKSIKE